MTTAFSGGGDPSRLRNEVFSFGDDVAFVYDTIDADAYVQKFSMSAGGATHVPLAVLGVDINNVDLGANGLDFSGFTQPHLLVTDLDRDSAVGFGFSADDVAIVYMELGDGTVRQHIIPDVASGTFAMTGTANNFTVEDAVTNAVTTAITLGHNSTGTPAASFGVGLDFNLETDTTPDVLAASLDVIYTDPTNGFQIADMIFSLFTSSEGAITELLRLDGSTGAVEVAQLLQVSPSTSLTTSTGNIFNLDLSSTGTPGVGFGSNMRFLAENTASLSSPQAQLTAEWSVATDGVTRSIFTIAVVQADGDNLTNAFFLDGSLLQARLRDDYSFAAGTNSDAVFHHRAATLTANTALANVLVGTPVVPAIPANSLIISNITADGDIIFATNTGGNSIELLHLDTSGQSVNFGTSTTLNATGGGALTGTWTDLGSVTTVDINGGTIDGATIGATAPGAITGTTIDATTDFTIGSTVITDGVITDATGLQIAAALDMANNILSNVGGPENNWSASSISVSTSVLNSVVQALIKNTDNTGAVSNAQLRLEVGGTSGGDPRIQFIIPGGGELVTLGLDNSVSDNFTISDSAAIGSNDRLRLAITTGVLSVDGAGAGTALPTLFDEYDDVKELRGFQLANVPGTALTYDLQRENQRRLVDIGVAEWAMQEDGTYHWMMQVQPMLRLLAGGIWQNRQLMNSWIATVDEHLMANDFWNATIEERLAAVEEANQILIEENKTLKALIGSS